MEQTVLSINDDKMTTRGELIEYPAELIGGRNLLPTAFNLYSTEGLYGYIRILDEEENIILKLYEEDNSVDMGRIYFGFTGNGHSAEDGYRWAMANGSLTGNLNDNLEMAGSRYKFFSYFSNNRETFDKIFSRFKIKIERGNKVTDWTPAPEDLGLSYPDWVTEFKPSISEDGILAPEFDESGVLSFSINRTTAQEFKENPNL